MTAWVLIFVVGIGKPSPATAQFSDYNSCYVALKHIKEQWPGYADGFCTPYSGAKP